MNYKEWQPVLFEELKKHMASVPDKSPAHDIDHILRVWKKCEILGKQLKVDMEVLIAAVFLHDLGRHFGQEKHGELSAEKAAPILEKIKFPEEKREAVLKVIRFHEYFVPKEKRDSVEAKVLSDVDRVDALGYVGIMRHLLFYYARGTSIEEIISIIKKRWDSIELKESREVGRKDYEVIMDYFENLEKEISG